MNVTFVDLYKIDLKLMHHISAVPSPELVDKVRDLYHKRVSDVRFLIPVLNGLSKVH